ncbi:MAG: SAM-dependent methyltransferase [Chloroflexi bacterium]|nr:MAG: SAM-dependent methyltransferase [Chloroflexota bacterium]
MSESDKVSWDKRYADGSYHGREEPSALLKAWIDNLPKGRALDLACGTGRNGLFLAEHGYSVDGLDISDVALKKAQESAEQRSLEVNWVQADFDNPDLPQNTYDVIVNCRFMDRDLIPRMKDALKDGGYILFEHHLLSNDPSVNVGGPSSYWRLRPNELLHQFLDLRVISYDEFVAPESDGRTAALVWLVASKGDAGF